MSLKKLDKQTLLDQLHSKKHEIEALAGTPPAALEADDHEGAIALHQWVGQIIALTADFLPLIAEQRRRTMPPSALKLAQSALAAFKAGNGENMTRLRELATQHPGYRTKTSKARRVVDQLDLSRAEKTIAEAKASLLVGEVSALLAGAKSVYPQIVENDDYKLLMQLIEIARQMELNISAAENAIAGQEWDKAVTAVQDCATVLNGHAEPTLTNPLSGYTAVRSHLMEELNKQASSALGTKDLDTARAFFARMEIVEEDSHFVHDLHEAIAKAEAQEETPQPTDATTSEVTSEATAESTVEATPEATPTPSDPVVIAKAWLVTPNAMFSVRPFSGGKGPFVVTVLPPTQSEFRVYEERIIHDTGIPLPVDLTLIVTDQSGIPVEGTVVLVFTPEQHAQVRSGEVTSAAAFAVESDNGEGIALVVNTDMQG